MGKVAITINGTEPKNIFPAFILGSTSLAVGDDVIIYFSSYAAPVLKKGVLESMTDKGMPEMEDLIEGVVELGGRMVLCELGLKQFDISEEELRDDVEVVMASTFLLDTQDANQYFSF